MVRMTWWNKLTKTKKIVLSVVLVFFVISIFGMILPDRPAENAVDKNDENISNQDLVPSKEKAELRISVLDGFNLNSQQGSIYSYTVIDKNQSVTVARGLDNLEGHQELYPLSRTKVEISGVSVDIGYNNADDYGREAYISLSFDFKYMDTNLTGEISNLDFKPNKDGLRNTLDMYITALKDVNK